MEKSKQTGAPCVVAQLDEDHDITTAERHWYIPGKGKLVKMPNLNRWTIFSRTNNEDSSKGDCYLDIDPSHKIPNPYFTFSFPSLY